MKRWAAFSALAAAYLLARAALWPAAVNTHAIMYALVAERPGANALELFHPLYVPALVALRGLRRAAGLTGPALAWFQAFSLAGALLNLLLIYLIALRVLGDRKSAWLAAFLATASINLWAWSLQTMPYTWATALLLLCVLLLLEARPWTAARAAAIGALTGAAMGLDTACLVLAPLTLVEIFRGAPEPAKPAACFASGLMLALAASYVPYLALGRLLPGSPGQLLAGLPEDIVTVLKAPSLAQQWHGLWASPAPADIPLSAAAVFYAALGVEALKRRRPAGEQAALRLGVGLFFAVTLFFWACDPHNRFVYAGGLLSPILFLLMFDRRRTAAALALWACLVGKNLAWPADYLPARNLGLEEARFLRSALKPSDALLALSEPDWLFSYAFDSQARLLRLERAEKGAPAGSDAWTPGPALNAELRRLLCSGAAVWLASDALFRDSNVAPQRLEAAAAELLRSWKGKIATAAPRVSPQGQHYYPLIPAVACASKTAGGR